MVTDLDIAKKLVNLESSASSRGKEFNLSLKTVRRLLTIKKCFFTGVVMVEEHLNDAQRTIDRVDNSKGYIEGNVVACTRRINIAKGNLSVEEIKALCVGVNKIK